MQTFDETVVTLTECTVPGDEKRMSISTSCSSLMTTHQPTTTSILLEENIRRTIAAGEKPSVVSRSPVRLRTASSLQSQSTIVKSERQSNVSDTADATETSSEPSVQSTSTAQRYSKAKRLQSARKSRDTDHDIHATPETYPYKSPFPKEYDQAILLQAHLVFTNNPNDWSLKDFYRDVKVRLEPETNAKEVFEKCLKLARLQASTIKGEQRRRPNELGISRPIKSAAFDRASTSLRNSSVSPKPPNDKDTQDGSESKLEIRCADCKSTACTGSQECPSSKRLSPSSLSPNMRDTTPARLTSRLARAALPARPRTSHPATREARWRSEQTRMNPVILTPSFETELSNKRAQTPFANGFLPGKLIRSQRRETLTTVPPQRASS